MKIVAYASCGPWTKGTPVDFDTMAGSPGIYRRAGVSPTSKQDRYRYLSSKGQVRWVSGNNSGDTAPAKGENPDARFIKVEGPASLTIVHLCD